MSALAPVLQGFFSEHLAQRRASPHTVSSYRDTYRLLLRYAEARTGKAPAALNLGELDVDLIGGFLEHLERDRHVGVRTRNLRLTAIHSLLTYASYRCPEHAETIRRVLTIPAKAPDRTVVTFLTKAEVTALLAAPDRSTPLGERDHVLLLVGIEDGLRVSDAGRTSARRVRGEESAPRRSGPPPPGCSSPGSASAVRLPTSRSSPRGAAPG
jgi:integrase/recombinase XerD